MFVLVRCFRHDGCARSLVLTPSVIVTIVLCCIRLFAGVMNNAKRVIGHSRAAQNCKGKVVPRMREALDGIQEEAEANCSADDVRRRGDDVSTCVVHDKQTNNDFKSKLKLVDIGLGTTRHGWHQPSCTCGRPQVCRCSCQICLLYHSLLRVYVSYCVSSVEYFVTLRPHTCCNTVSNACTFSCSVNRCFTLLPCTDCSLNMLLT